MPDIKPFAGLRFNLAKPGDLGNYAAPPYDMIEEEMARKLYAKHEHNCVRIIQNLKEPGDKANKDRHLRAGKFFDEWRKKGVLVSDKEQAFYLYEQKFTVPGADKNAVFERLGIIARIRLVPFSDGIVLPHEYTFAGPKADRYELLETIRTSTGQIFGIISDEKGDFYAGIKKARQGAVLGTFTDVDGTVHNLYRIIDKAVIDQLAMTAQGRTVLIADGHHRYETALNYWKNTGAPDASHTMMTLVSAKDPGLLILSFHRLLRRCRHTTGFNLKRLKEFFSVKNLGQADIGGVNGFMASTGGPVLLYLDNASKKLYGLSVNEAGEHWLAGHADGKSHLWTHLNVSLINMLVLRGLLNIDINDSVVVHDTLDFSNDNQVAFDRALDGDTYHGAIFLRPANIDTITSVVEKNERMPQKSTCFFPKLYSGLVFNPLGNP
jgi:uncharacterized protein (DUF1015 family)